MPIEEQCEQILLWKFIVLVEMSDKLLEHNVCCINTYTCILMCIKHKLKPISLKQIVIKPEFTIRI